MKTLLLTALLLSTSFLTASRATTPPTPQIAQLDDNILTPQQVQQTAKNITVRINSSNNGGSGVIIAQKGSNYLILTNAHVVKRATKIEIQAPDGQKYQATAIDGGFDSKYDLALLQFTSKTKYTLANLSSVSGSPIEPERTIYSAGFPFDSSKIRITKGEVSQLSDIPFNDGTQIGYVTDKGEKGIRQGMSGGAIFDAQGNLLGINTIGIAPILPDYTYNDGSKPTAKLKAQYRQANWGIPVYNFLTNVKADILYGYDNLPKVERKVTPTGYMAKLNIKARQMTVRIENSGGSGSGVIVARDASGYYVLTAKHVFQDPNTQQKHTNNQIITYDQDRHIATGTVVAEGVDLAVVKFTSNTVYPIARLGEYSQNQSDFVFVGGFPGRLNINSPLWQWQLNPGYIFNKEQGKFQVQNNQSFSNGYNLIYTSISYGGMSGGPAFDSVGNVIGIHGRTESADLNSLGISIQTFIGLAARLQIVPSLLSISKTNPIELNLGDRQNVIAAIKNLPQPQMGSEGKHWLAYANQLYRTGQYDQSAVAFERAINGNQRLLGSHGKSLSLAIRGRYQLAGSAISQAIAAIPSNEQTNYYYFWKEQSFFFKALGKYNDAIKAINIAIQLSPNDLSLTNEKANIFQEQKQYLAAISLYDETIRKQPQAYLYNNRGNAKYALGNRQEAIIDFSRAIDGNPNDFLAYYNRGMAKSSLGNPKQAIIDYDRAITLNPKFAQAYVGRGIIKYESGNKKDAISDLDRAIFLDSNYIEAYYNRGVINTEIGNKKSAIVDYDRVIALSPKDAAAYLNRGINKFQSGNKQGGIFDVSRAANLSQQQGRMDYYQKAIDVLQQMKKM
jgi:tetratricopeptide (TPR) repeat protein